MFAKIVIDMKNDNINDYYDYLIPEQFIDFVGVGSRVLVEFGYQDLLGYVIEVSENSDYKNHIKEIKMVLEYEKELLPEQIELAKYISNYYHVSLANVLDLMIPSFLKGQKRNYLKVKDYNRLHPVLHMLFEGKTKVMINSSILKNYNLVKKEIANSNITVEYELYSYGKSKLQRIYRVQSRKETKSVKRNKIIDFVSNHPDVTEEMILSYIDCSEWMIKTLVKEGYLSYQEVAILDDDLREKIVHNEYKYTFSQEQTVERFFKSKSMNFLLFSNDYDFKNSFYLDIIKNNQTQNKATVFITPTVFIAEELLMFFRKKLDGYNIISMNSKNSQSDNYNAFMNSKHNNFDVLVCTTSGVFLPFSNVGTFVVVDEENINYIKENYPYYETKKVVEKRSELINAKVLYTSSSPSIESYYNCEIGELELLSTGKSILGNVNIVDMKDSILNGSNIIISNTLKEKMDESLQSGKQVVLIINNKSYSNIIRCRDCGNVIKCPTCGIPLTYYKEKNIMKCNYCDLKLQDFSKCLNCSSTNMISFGFGLEQVHELLDQMYPNKKVLRIDSDVLRSIEDYDNAILQIEEGFADIIIGTNILTKYVNTSNIDLIAMLDCDKLLFSNHYQANEMLFNNIQKIVSSNNVVLQTYYPTFYTIKYASKGDYESFYDEEIKKRKDFKYSPFNEVNRISVTGEYKEMYHFINYFKKVFTRIVDGSVLGPVYDPKIKGVRLILKHNDISKVYKIYDDTCDSFKQKDIKSSFERKIKVM